MRQDAVMNSDAIVEAARKLLIEQGAGVSMRAIAREAGVGLATASRHFPSRIELLGTCPGIIQRSQYQFGERGEKD